MKTDLAGKVAWVTGASSGLGHRFAQVLAAEGATVAISARRAERLEALAAEIAAAGGRAVCVPLDMADIAAIAPAAAQIEKALGPIDILVNNAGLSRQARLEDFTEADYDAVLTVNLKAAFFAGQAAARQMIAHKRPGRIVNIASVAGFRALGGQAPYSMSKSGLIALTRCMAREWGRHGINANAICPGYISTEIGGDFFETEAGQKLIAALPRRRMGEPRDLDGLLLLLCSGEASRFINGAAMVADDGMMAI
ncbi:MAG: SDR family NAD(P)-dependent oxidoreductase [Alphaproteobacteria bacterium]|nr:SDR family NAD(P)-dependent oxidoreductase [Alphaproteobacteria bacterium]